MNNVVYFEIIAEDTSRAIEFYTNVFGWKITKTDMLTDYWAIETSPDGESKGIKGGLRKEMGIDKKEKTISVNAFVCTISTESLDESIEKIKANGGTMLNEKMEIPGVGTQAYFLDSEGNAFTVLQFEK